ncbi:MAG: ABC transporter substrate-binding protein, partial [Ktedonobacteraceae bacterium]|nr:ABC transporter substrate-binding protein [Ktedonobacteraceae bacterium]
HRFQSSGDRSSYTLSTSSSLAAQAPPPRTLPPQSPQQAVTAARGYQAPPPPPAMMPGYSQQRQSGMYAAPPAPAQRRKNPVLRDFILLLIVIVLISAVLFLLPRLATTGTGSPGTQPITPAASSVQGSNPISVRQAGNALIGLSDGSYAFDTDRPGGALKKQAAEKFQQGDYSGAMSLLRQALAQDTNDAEALIYLENARIMLAHAPYVTFVVGTMPSGDRPLVSVGRDNLQGAYVAQKEMNDSGSLPGGMKVRLLIASSGDQKENAASVAQQVALLSKSDKTFVGVMGWSFSSLTFAAVPVLSQARIPVVSPTASDDGLSGISPYFFRVVPPNKTQAVAGAKYAEETLGSKNAVVFVDPADPYSQSLASAFATQFKNDGRNVLATINYTVGQRDTVASGVQQALQNNPDLIYFAGHASDADALLVALSSQNVPPSLKILGGDALYESNGYSDGGSLRGRLHFTAFAYPDEWDILGMGDKKPVFFSNYAKAFDPDNKHKGLYGYSRPANDTMMSYDAMTALLKAYSSATGSKKGDDLKNALAQLSFQGVSGFIKFDSNGDPVNKAIVIIAVDDRGNNHLEKVLNKFTA